MYRCANVCVWILCRVYTVQILKYRLVIEVDCVINSPRAPLRSFVYRTKQYRETGRTLDDTRVKMKAGRIKIRWWEKRFMCTEPYLLTTSNSEEVKILTLWNSHAGASFDGTPLRQPSRRPLLHSPLAWSICGAIDCVGLRSNIKITHWLKAFILIDAIILTFKCQIFLSNIL